MASQNDKYTIEQVVEAAHRSHGLILLMAKSLGCERATVYSYIKRYKTVDTAVQQARGGIVDLGEVALVKKIQAGDTTSIIFALKTLGKDRGYVERSEITGKDGEGFSIEVTRRAES